MSSNPSDEVTKMVDLKPEKPSNSGLRSKVRGPQEELYREDFKYVPLRLNPEERGLFSVLDASLQVVVQKSSFL